MESVQQHKWVIFSLLTVICYGFCGPLQKKALTHGTTIHLAQICYGVLIAAIGLMGMKGQQFTSSLGLYYALLFGLMGGIGLKFVSWAFSVPGANVAHVSLIVGLFPLVTVVICYFWLHEHIIWSRFSLAVLFGALSIYCAITSQFKAP